MKMNDTSDTSCIPAPQSHVANLNPINVFGPTTNHNESPKSNNMHDYDPFQRVNSKFQATFWGTTFHIIFVTAGSFVFFVPKKFISIGYLNGSALMLLVILFYTYSMRSLLWSAYEICKFKGIYSLSYAELVFEAFNNGPLMSKRLAPWARLLILLDFILIWFNGSVFVYLTMAEYLLVVLSPYLNLSLKQIMVILLIPTLTISSIRRLKYLEPFSVIGFILSFISIILILYHLVTNPFPWQWPSNQGAIDKVPIFVGAILVTITITGLIIPLRNEMRSPRDFVKPCGVINVAFIITALVYYFLGLIFAAKYNTNIPENMLSVLPSESMLSQISIISYVLSFLFIYPLLIYVPFDVIWNDFLKDCKILTKHKLMWEYALRVALVSVCFSLAYANPDLSLFFSLSGTVGTSIDSIIFPAVIQTLVEWKLGKSRMKFGFIVAKNLIIFAIGIGLVMAGIQDCMRTDTL